ncbi:hypothetical protein [Rhizobium sullae]|uniref:hypothetical protein n=1 Tax=Rhizobium sullae TaxID=50338 RepID=UPI00117A2515|nr:hypothetical protein [Rhizobium sullae]
MENELQYFVEMAGGDGFRWVICCAMLFCVRLNCRVGMFGQEMTMLGCSVIEIMPSNGRLPAELIEAGYRSSQYGLVVFVLNNVTPQAINLVLDPVVRTMPLSIPGVLYIEIGDEQRVRDAITSASIIYFASNALYNLAASYGVSPALVYSDLPPQPSDTAELPAIHRQVPPPETVDWRRHSFHHVFAA